MERWKVAEGQGQPWYVNPSCTLSSVDRVSAEEGMALLQTYHDGPVLLDDTCCTMAQELPAGAVVVTYCSGCDRRFRQREDIRDITFWEAVDQMPQIPLPHYPQLQVSIHDSCAYRDQPQVHDAVRSLLKKMAITVVESPNSREKSVCCGGSRYPDLPLDEVRKMQQRRAAQMPCQDVVVTCPSCMKSMAIGGKTPHHLLHLILGKTTDPGELDWETYVAVKSAMKQQRRKG